MNDENPCGDMYPEFWTHITAGVFVWDYLAKQDLARSADRSTWFLYSIILAYMAVAVVYFIARIKYLKVK